MNDFLGPLIAGTTPTHSVRLYVQRQIELILKSEAYRSNPSGGTASDCLLIWQLLEMLVQQQGVSFLLFLLLFIYFYFQKARRLSVCPYCCLTTVRRFFFVELED